MATTASSSETQTKLSKKEKAEALKAIANDFYVKKDFKSAYQKYTEAIKADGSNAIYYANRAAASLAMQQYMNACTDANKAIEIDASYVKGHARLAAGNAGLGRWESAAKSWKKALALLPQDDGQLTPTERKLKEQFEAELQKAESKNETPLGEDAIRIGKDELSKVPWLRAKAEEDQLKADGNVNSSGWVILYAYREFSEGVQTMKALAPTTINGKEGFIGTTGGLVDLSNGVMRDPRVFHIDCSDWLEKYNKQVMFEVQKFKAWSRVGPKVIMEEAPKRLRKEGWDSVRPAISTTVRAWIMAGMLSFKIAKQLGAAYEFFSRAVELLEWGQRLWHNVPTTDRGTVFEQSFIRGVKRLKLETMFGRLCANEQCTYTKKQVADEALAIIDEIDANPPRGELDPGFVLSFWVYPKADALATVGWYHMQNGFSASSAENAKSHFEDALKNYTLASETLPPDDETAFQYLYVALEALWYSSQPIKKQLPLLIKMDAIGQKMMRFWTVSPTSEHTNDILQMLRGYADHLMQGLSSGKYKEENVVKPNATKSKDKWSDRATVYV